MKGKNIVVVDDDYGPVVQHLLIDVKRNGANLLPFTTFQDAWQDRNLIRKADFLLLDMILPLNTRETGSQDPNYLGFELLSEFRASGIEIPCLVYTVVQANDSPVMPNLEYRLSQMNAGYLNKPTLPGILTRKIMETAGWHPSEGRLHRA